MGKSDAAIERMTAKVVDLEVASDAIVALVTGMAAEMREVADDPEQVTALADRVEAQAKKLADKTLENTPQA